MSKNKVMQTATCEVETVIDDAGLDIFLEGLTSIGAMRNSKGSQPYLVALHQPIKKWHGYSLVYAQISYTAMGANRNDVYRRVDELNYASSCMFRVSSSVITKN